MIRYYADFILVPVLIVLALPGAYGALSSIAAGFVLWTLAEYVIHRYLFHQVFRHEHWMHHIRPQSHAVAISSYVSAGIHLTALFITYNLDLLGWYVGLALGYFAYIVVHDRLHFGHRSRMGWWMTRRVILHDIHHRGVEANFGVVTSIWDSLFKTLCYPSEVDRWLERQRNRLW